MKKRLITLITLATIIALIGGYFWANRMTVTASQKNMSLILAKQTVQYMPSIPSPAYQILIPNAPGDITELSSYGGNNWFAINSKEKEFKLYREKTAGEVDTLVEGITITPQLDIVIDPSSRLLKWNNQGNISLPLGQVTIKAGEQYTIETGENIVSPWLVKYSDYVSGTGIDTYNLENAPQIDDERNLPITSVTIKYERGNPLIRINNQNYFGDYFEINPSTGLAFTWEEIDSLQAGIQLKNQKCSWLRVIIETEIHSQTFYPITPVEVTSGVASDSWEDIDVSSYIASGATGVCIHYYSYNDGVEDLGLRKNGSTDTRTDAVYNINGWAAIGVDANRIFEAYLDTPANQDLYIVGYTMSGVTFNTNGIDKSLGTTLAWTDIDCSSEAPSAIGLIFEVDGTSVLSQIGMRKNGSSDARSADNRRHHCFSIIIGCDGSQISEGYISDTNTDFYLTGYITDGATFNTNATDLSLSTTDSWEDLDALGSSDAIMGFIEVNSASTRQHGLRENGSSEDLLNLIYNHCWAVVECDASQIIEGYINNVDVDFFEVGYATEEAEPDIYVSPTSRNLGIVMQNGTYWTNTANSTPPSWPLTDGDAYFTVTNNGSMAVDITIKGTNFTGGSNNWTLVHTSPGSNEVRWSAWYESGNLTDNTTFATTEQNFISSLAASANIDIELRLETGTFDLTEGGSKASTITLTAGAS